MFILQVPPPGFGVDDGDALETPEDPAVPEDPPIPEEVAPTISANPNRLLDQNHDREVLQ